VPAVSWTVVATSEWKIAGKRVVGRQLVGTVDNSAYPKLGVEICMTLVTKSGAKVTTPDAWWSQRRPDKPG